MGPRPDQTLVLYEAEYCPYCRKVRNVLTSLDLDAEIRPVPKRSKRFSEFVRGNGGKIPILCDPNSGQTVTGSNAIIHHLFSRYGAGEPSQLSLNTAIAAVPSAIRGRKGMYLRASIAPGQPLELYNTESSPYCRIVRERLCELEIPYVVRNVAKGGLVDFVTPPWRGLLGLNGTATTTNRQRLFDRARRYQIPFLVDPNTDVELFESVEICRYLDRTYAWSPR